MRLHDLLHEEEAESKAPVGALGNGAFEAFEDALAICRWNANPLIHDLEAHLIGPGSQSDLDGEISSVLDRVRKEGFELLFEPNRVNLGRQHFGSIHRYLAALVARQFLELHAYFSHPSGYITRFPLDMDLALAETRVID